MPEVQAKKAFFSIRTQNIDHTAALAALFGVSKQAMGFFMRDHNLV